jgi:hypothetical protein
MKLRLAFASLALSALSVLVTSWAQAANTVIEVDVSVNPSAGTIVLNNSPAPVFSTNGSNQTFVGDGPSNVWSFAGTFSPVTFSPPCCGQQSLVLLNISFTSPLQVPFPDPHVIPVDNSNTWLLATVSVTGPSIPPLVLNQTEYGPGLIALNQNLTTMVNPSGITGPLISSTFRYGLAAEVPLNLISTDFVYFQGSSPLVLDSFSVSVRVAANAPEPATWAMMLLGFAGLAFAFRQSKRKASAA